MKDLSNLEPAPGSNKTRKRLGRGIGSGLGKTAGKGHKGQLARSGGAIRVGFEGGQTPLYRRLPKYGFKNTDNKIHFQIIKLEDLNVFEDGAIVSKTLLLDKGLIKYVDKPVKLLSNGTIKKKITIKVDKVSKSAKAALEQKGGAVEEI